MKRTLISTVLLLLIVSLNLKSQDTNKVYPKIQKVVVYQEDAQIEKSITVSLKKGFNEFVLAGNSNVLNTKSIQFNNNSNYSIMEFTPYIQFVKADQVAEEKLSESTRKRVKIIKDSIEILRYKFAEIRSFLSVMDKEKISLENMKVITYSSSIDSMPKMKEGLAFFRDKMTEVNGSIQKKQKEKEELLKAIEDYNSNLKLILQGSEKDNIKDKSEYYIKVNIYSEKNISKINLEYRYIVNNIFWLPIYDINIFSNDENVKFVLKSELQQKTGEDWDDVKLVFSTEQPNNQGQLAELEPTFYTLRPAQYQTSKQVQGPYGTLTGTVSDAKTAEPIPFVNITLEQNNQRKGGAVTDVNGNYQIKGLYPGNYDIVAASVSYRKSRKNGVRVSPSGYSTGGSMTMVPSTTSLDDVTILEYSVPLTEIGTAEAGKRITSDDIEKMAANSVDAISVTVGGISDIDGEIGYARGEGGMVKYVNSVSSTQENTKYEYATEDNNTALVNKMLGKEYEVAMNYTIKSGDKPKIIPLETSTTKASYKYFSVPKMEKVVYLSALLSDWEDMQLMSAGAKVYLDNNFIKDIYINSNSIEDTLNLPIGREKRVVIDRKSDKKLVTKTGFMSTSFETTVTITLNIKNNTQSIVNLKVDDQIPVSKTDEITITPNDLAKAVFDEKTGKLTWNLNLNALESKTINFSYTVKHPKGANLSFN